MIAKQSELNRLSLADDQAWEEEGALAEQFVNSHTVDEVVDHLRETGARLDAEEAEQED